MSNNVTYNITPEECLALEHIKRVQNDVYFSRHGQKVTLYVLYCCLIVFGTLGNLSVIWAVTRSKCLRNLRNYFILHLACSDLLLCLVTAPTTLYLAVNLFWELGQLGCQLVASTQAMNTFVSSLTLAAIALDRYLLIIFPVSWRSQSSAPLFLVLLGVWALSLLLACPYFFAVGEVPVDNIFPWNVGTVERYLMECGTSRPKMCLETNWDDSFLSRSVYSIVIFLLQYLIPLSALVFVYTHIGRQTVRARPGFVMNSRTVEREKRKQRRTLLLLSSLVAVFAICWLPSNLYCILTALDVWQFSQNLYMYFHLIGVVTAGANPIMYGIFNSNFRQVYLNALPRRRGRHTERQNSGCNASRKRRAFAQAHCRSLPQFDVEKIERPSWRRASRGSIQNGSSSLVQWKFGETDTHNGNVQQTNI